MRWTQEFVTGLAEAATRDRGFDALRKFAKQLVLGASREVGHEDMEQVYCRELTRVFDKLEVLARLTFANEGGFFRWYFPEVWVACREEHASRSCDGVVLIGMDGDARFFFVGADEFSVQMQTVDSTMLVRSVSHPDLERWEQDWRALVRQERLGDAHGPA